jgi:hypothetical protein
MRYSRPFRDGRMMYGAFANSVFLQQITENPAFVGFDWDVRLVQPK